MGKSQGRPVRYEFTEENINVIAAIAAEKGIEAYKEEHRKEEAERQSRVQNNAKALLTNYRRFKDYIENAEYDMDTTSDDSLKDMLSLIQDHHRPDLPVHHPNDRKHYPEYIYALTEYPESLQKQYCVLHFSPLSAAVLFCPSHHLPEAGSLYHRSAFAGTAEPDHNPLPSFALKQPVLLPASARR